MNQLENAQGTVDFETREKLKKLEKALGTLMEARSGSEAPSSATEVAVARELDIIDSRLQALERRIESIDPRTHDILKNSEAQSWLQQLQNTSQ